MIEYESLKQLNQSFIADYKTSFNDTLESGWYILGNKVKEFEEAKANPSVAQADKEWMKNVIHVVGANDAGTEAQIRPYMTEYSRMVSDTLFGGSVNTSPMRTKFTDGNVVQSHHAI